MSHHLNYADISARPKRAHNSFAVVAAMGSSIAIFLALSSFPIRTFNFVFSLASVFVLGSFIFLLIAFRRRAAYEKFTLAVAVLLMVASLVAMGSNYRRAQRERGGSESAEHLRGLGIAIKQYADSNGSKLPDSLEQLVVSGLLPAEYLVYAGSGNIAASGTGVELQRELSQPNHNSYVYLGRSKTYSELSRDDVVAYEVVSDPSVEGVNVLAGDGHTEWVTLPQLKAALATPHNQLQQFHK